MIREELIQYARECIASPDTCCVKHRWACERFLRDIEKEGTEEFPYIFDESAAARFFKWATFHRHTKGPLAGKPIELVPLQRFIFGNVYGWKHKDTGMRRFSRAYWQVARKNAKSQSLAIVGTYELMALGESASEVYIGATKRRQAKIIYDEAYAMLNRAPELAGKWAQKYGRIVHEKSGSFIETLSKEDGKKGDGLNPQAGLIDEYHAHDNDEVMAVLRTGMIARAQPLLFIITTAGTNLAGPCYRDEYPTATKILDPAVPFDVPSYFVMINELDRDEGGEIIDDIADERAWLKANPIAATYEHGRRNIREALELAQINDAAREAFLTKNMNVWLESSAAAYMDIAKWRARGVVEDIEAEIPKGNAVYVGLDLSSKIDLTAAVIVAPLEGGRYAILPHAFIPAAQVTRRERSDHVPYSTWARAGYLTITDGEVVDYRYITKWINETVERLGVSVAAVCYDPWNATQYAQELTDDGLLCIEVRQGPRTLSEPSKTFRELAYTGKILHAENPLYDWTLSNCVTREDPNNNILIDKARSPNRIDPVAATINAMTRAIVKEEEKPDINAHILAGGFTL